MQSRSGTLASRLEQFAARHDSVSLDSLRGLVEAAGLQTLAIHSLAISDDPEADLALVEPLIAAASALGAPYLHCGVRSPLSDPVTTSARRIARRARESDVDLAIEFLPFLPVASIADTRAIVRACEEVGYDGAVGLELLSEESRGRSPREVAGEVLRASLPYWDGSQLA